MARMTAPGDMFFPMPTSSPLDSLPSAQAPTYSDGSQSSTRPSSMSIENDMPPPLFTSLPQKLDWTPDPTNLFNSTPTTSDGWSFPPTIDPGQAGPGTPFQPYTPLNTHTSLTPMLASWSTSPSTYSTPQDRPGPMRTLSNSLPRKRAPTLQQPYQPTSYQAPTPLYFTSASMSAIPPAALVLPDRRLSTPVLGPYTAAVPTFPVQQNLYLAQGQAIGQRIHPAPPGGDMLYDHLESKAPRFRPTKDQLAILVESYDQNKNPDAATREALARRLGPDIRPKTLQIWFQNRRSKSRAKEREQRIPRQLSLGGTREEEVKRRGSGVDMGILRALVRDEDPALQIIPISVLSISTWTRFLTPGLFSPPDLCLSLRLPSLMIYVSHSSDTYRITIPLVPGSRAVEGLTAAANPSLNKDAVLVKFELCPRVCGFAVWTEGAGWVDTGDFSGGAVGSGGKVEITGERETLLPAFAQIQQHLFDIPLPTPITFTHQTDPTSPITPTPQRTSHHPTPFASDWCFPSITATTPSTASPMQASAPNGPRPAVRMEAMGHVKQRSLSAPISMPAEFKAGSEEQTGRMGTWGSAGNVYGFGSLGGDSTSATALASASISAGSMASATEISTPPYILSTEYMGNL